MTIAYDIHTGAVVGQVVDLHPAAPAAPKGPHEIALYGNGRYVTVPRSSVRLEVLP